MSRIDSTARLFLIVALAVLAAGCGTIRHMKELPAGTAVAAPKPGKAVVVFMRSARVGGSITASVFEIRNDNPEIVGLVSSNTKVAYEVDPGKRLFMVISETADYMSADLAPNRTYYAFVTPRMGVWRARFSLAAVNKNGNMVQAAQNCLKDCRLIVKTPEADDWARANMNDIRSKHAEVYPRWNQRPAGERPHLASADGV
jgi:hypothetical protein